jgi:hypothetical protein
VHSASGECHYLVLPKDCAPEAAVHADAADACTTPAIARFTLVTGESHQISGLQKFRLCVGSGSDAGGADCQSLMPGGGREG